MTPEISRRGKNLGTEKAFVVAKEMQELLFKDPTLDIVPFHIGQPSFDTPNNIKQAAIKAIEDGKTGYTPSAGILDARVAVAKYFSETRGINVSPDSVVLDCGSKPFIYYAVVMTTDPGQEVIYPVPGYPIYESQITLHGAKPVPLPLREKNKFKIDIGELKSKVNENTRLLILNSPHNPTGIVLTEEDLGQIADIVLEHDLWVLADEIYSRIVYDGPFKSIASIKGMQERTILMDGLSKTYAMTGWRLGFAANEKLAERLGTGVTNTTACASHMGQYATIEALTGPQDEAKKMVEKYRERRDLIVDGLNEIDGISCDSPSGAFYVWANVTEACKLIGAKDSEEFRIRLLKDAKVAVTSDNHFGGRITGEGEHNRFSYVTSTDNIEKGLWRISNYITKHTMV